MSQCVISQSIYHWANKCPDWHDDDDDDDDDDDVDDDSSKINVTLFSQEIFECYNTKFIREILNGAELDSGCTQTVCGKTWLSIYIDSLAYNDKVKVTEKKWYCI